MKNYTETWVCLIRARDALAEAHVAMAPDGHARPATLDGTSTQIDRIERMLSVARQELEAARSACVEAGRGDLSSI